jgi:hypothetical protein
MFPISNPEYWIQKKANRKTGYPIATIAYYGPTDKLATKVVVGILLSEKSGEEVDFIEKWFLESIDVRRDKAINLQIVNFLDQHRVQRVAMVEQIIGCPHEEGIDYPEGEKCPQCPFWANRDRWTGDVIE